MKKLLNIVLVAVLVVSFVVGVMATDSQAANSTKCYTYCDGEYQIECCFYTVQGQGRLWKCWWTGYYCM